MTKTPSQSGGFRNLFRWLVGTMTVLLTPVAALCLCFACSPGTDMHDAPYILVTGLVLLAFVVIGVLGWVVLRPRDPALADKVTDDAV